MRPYLKGNHRQFQLSKPRLHRLSRRLHPAFFDDLPFLAQEAAVAPLISQIYSHRQFHLPALRLQRSLPCFLFVVLAILLHMAGSFSLGTLGRLSIE